MYQLVADNSDMFKQISPTVTMTDFAKIGSDTLTATSITGVSEDYFDTVSYTHLGTHGCPPYGMSGHHFLRWHYPHQVKGRSARFLSAGIGSPVLSALL